jgi:pimeloyl-ACP methyl ester carboxylesterase
MPQSYARTLAREIRAECRVQTITGAGHLAWLDQPQKAAEAIEAFLA